MQSVKDMVVMITGASSGFGAETAKLLGAKGAKLVLGARREDRLKALCDEIGENAVYSVCDITKKEDALALASRGLDSFGKINALVNNAGIAPNAALSKGTVEDWDRMIDVNIKGVLYAIHAVLHHMMERGSGTIVNISSVAALRVLPSAAVYSATKSAIRAISDGLRMETGGKIRVSCVYPGAFATEILDTITDPDVAAWLKKTGFNKIAGDPRQVAEAIVSVLEQNPELSLSDVVIRPTAQAF